MSIDLSDDVAYIIGKEGIWFTVSGDAEIKEKSLKEFVRKIMDEPELMIAIHDQRFNFDVHLLEDDLEDLKNAVSEALTKENNYFLQECLLDE